MKKVLNVDAIKKALEEKGMTQADFGRQAKFASCDVSRYMSGVVMPKRKTLLKISEFLGISESDLVVKAQDDDDVDMRLNCMAECLLELLDALELDELPVGDRVKWFQKIIWTLGRAGIPVMNAKGGQNEERDV